MLMRRELMLGAACGAVSPWLTACSSGAYDEAARSLRRPFASNSGDDALLMQELVRYATLAPSSHNTQCWRFRVHEQAQRRSMAIEPDLSRRTPVVDPDDHHLFVSLGCATENLVQAALANGLRADARFDPAGAGSVVVTLGGDKGGTVTPVPSHHRAKEFECDRCAGSFWVLACRCSARSF